MISIKARQTFGLRLVAEEMMQVIEWIGMLPSDEPKIYYIEDCVMYKLNGDKWEKISIEIKTEEWIYQPSE